MSSLKLSQKAGMILLVVAVYLPTSATIINIPDDYSTIQQGIDASSDGDTVLVQPGAYYENINFNGHNITLGSLFFTTGDTSYISTTVIDGDSSGSVVRFHSNEDSTTVITGFTIQNGLTAFGGGIYCNGSSPIIANNIIINNIASSFGGGIECVHDSNPIIINNNISENSANDGGGIDCLGDSKPKIIGNTISDNTAIWGGGINCWSAGDVIIYDNIITVNSGAYGGGINSHNSDVKIVNNIIKNNLASSFGGGIYCTSLIDATISNNTIIGNSAKYGGGVHCRYSSPELTNNNIIENSASSNGSGIICMDHSHPAITNTILWANGKPEYPEIYCDSLSAPVINFCDIQGGWEGVGNIDIDPLFRGRENDDFYLMAVECGDPYDSPCIDMGHPDILDSLLDCSWGLGTVLSDMGAFGGRDLIPHVGRIINIPDDYPTIQAGINASSDGDTILVQPGIYVENINFVGFNIVVGSLFLTTGDTSYISSTIIDGDSSGSVVVFETEEDSTAIFSGFTIRNGSALKGGGIYCNNYSSPIITNNIIRCNIADEKGGGICCRWHSNAIIVNNTIYENSARWWGGGIYCSYYSDPFAKNNKIISNSAMKGGGIFCYWNTASTIANNLIIGNSASCYGGGIYCYSFSYDMIINNTISANSADTSGGGISCFDGCSPIITNMILWDNNAPDNTEIYVDEWSSPIFTFCNIQDTLWPGEGNIDIDPLFRNPESGDFHLMATYCGDPYDSPCIDAGHPDILDSLLDCDWGLGELRSDMGGYGGGDSAQVGLDNIRHKLPGQFALSQNYPNPFNNTTAIYYILPEPSHITIDIYDLLGRKVITLIDKQQSTGYHHVIWKAEDAVSGIYFYRINASDYTETKKMMLLK